MWNQLNANFKEDERTIEPVEKVPGAMVYNTVVARASQKQLKTHSPEKRNRDFLRTLRKAADESNSVLKHRNSPFRFRIESNGRDVNVEVAVLDNNGKLVNVLIKDITNDDFARSIEDFSNIEGLIIDTIA
jgi:uncharacterized membrane protein